MPELGRDVYVQLLGGGQEERDQAGAGHVLLHVRPLHGGDNLTGEQSLTAQ